MSKVMFLISFKFVKLGDIRRAPLQGWISRKIGARSESLMTLTCQTISKVNVAITYLLTNMVLGIAGQKLEINGKFR